MTLQLSHFDLNLLRPLDTLLTEKSVTRAAEKLCVTQQAMSGSLKRLREHFSDDLLVRIGSRLELTPLGGALVAPVREALLQVGLALETTPCFEPGIARRRFRVAMSDYAALVILPLLLRRLLAQAPAILCDILPLDDLAFVGLDTGELDLCLLPSFWRLHQHEPTEVIRSVPLYEDDFVCAVDASVHTFEDLPLERYLALPHTAVRLNGGHHTIIDDAWVKSGIAPRVVATSTSFSNLIFMIAGTPMVATVQRRLARKLDGNFPMRLFKCPFQIGPLQQELSWHARNDADLAHRYLRDLFLSAARDMETAVSG
jgi:LysR family transcriptional regulator, nod-box dependent transcriptional activator